MPRTRRRRTESVRAVHPARTSLRIGIDGRVLSDAYHGIGRVAEALVHELAQVPGVEVVLVLSNRPNRRFDTAALLASDNVEPLWFHVPLTSPLQALAWVPKIRAAGVDVMVFPYHLGAPLTGAGPRLVMMHDCILESRAEFAPSWRVRWAYRLLSAAITRTNRVVAPSLASAREVERYYRVPRAEVALVPNGVAAKFAEPAGDGAAVRRRLDLPDRYLLQVGVRRPHKNVGVLVEMLQQLPERHLVLVGSVDERFPDPVPELARRLGVADRVHHVPYAPEELLVDVYQQADALLYPSLTEGFGLPLLEAMAAGTPVVASDIPAFAELAGDAAVLVPPQNPRAWAEAVKVLLGDEGVRDAAVARGRELAATYTWQRSAQALLSAAEHVTGRRPGLAAADARPRPCERS